MAVAEGVTVSVGIRVIVEVRVTIEVGAGVTETVGSTVGVPVPAQAANRNSMKSRYNVTRMISLLLFGSKCIDTVIGVFIHNLQGITLRWAIISFRHHEVHTIVGGYLWE